jgi:uncharacterized protein YbbC (DUF1343 family)
MPRVASGLDVLRSQGFERLRGRRLGVLCHPASVASDLTHLLDLLARAGLDVRVVFGPEHGLQGQAQDMQAVGPGPGGRSGPHQISLYGDSEASLHPPAGSLDEIDLLVVDLQDIGSRYYTFAVSMRYCMQACAAAGVAVLVLDRPNPINGRDREGPLLEDACRSFVGGFGVPVRHGLTLAELARLAVAEGIGVELEIVEMQGWLRRMWFDSTGLPWVLPSPNMPGLDTATVYPGACLVEATNLSEGRGTTRPFELIGAPWLDGRALAAGLGALGLPGVAFRPAIFAPTFHKHAGQACHGVQLHLTDRDAFQPFLTGACLLQQARAQNPERFAWRAEPYEFVDDRPAIDLLAGSAGLRRAIEACSDLPALAEQWCQAMPAFEQGASPSLLYR